jgi:hypothetical protein
MKRMKIVMASAFVLAIGSAFVTKASNRPTQHLGFIQTATACTSINTPCVTTAAIACGATVYAGQDPNDNSKCLTLLMKKNP